jgi:hypothetical protein
VAVSVFGAAAMLLPAAAVGSGSVVSTASRAVKVMPGLHFRGNASYFYNWSGYAETGSKGAYSEVFARWNVPAVSATPKASYSSSWVGIDGDNNSDLIQTGTESDYYGGKAHYYAWWEILPAAETLITSLTVSPGDSMAAYVDKDSGTKWTMYIDDETTGQEFSIVKKYTGPADSVEIIQEATTVNGKIGPLAHYGSVTFTVTGINNVAPVLKKSEEIFMINSADTKVISSPSLPSTAGNAFTVDYGPTQPPPPTAN